MQVLRDKLSEREKQTIARIERTNGESARFIGEGATALVYKFTKGRVVRIQTKRRDYDPEMYLRWAKYCLVSRSKHVPKFDYLAYEVSATGKVIKVISVLEQLQDLDSTLARKSKNSDCYLGDDLTDMIGDFLNDERKWNTRLVPTFLLTGIQRRAMASIRKTLHKHRVEINDMHAGNCMIRKSDGRLVITDPSC